MSYTINFPSSFVILKSLSWLVSVHVKLGYVLESSKLPLILDPAEVVSSLVVPSACFNSTAPPAVF